MLKIIPVPALKDNYIWLLIHGPFSQAVVVDPGDAGPVMTYLEQQKLSLAAIWVTHKHGDHSAGIGELLKAYPGTAVYAHPIENLALTTHGVAHNDVITIEKWPFTFKVIHIPGHTMGHVAFYGEGLLFSGDTLFAAGCGRIFEGTAQEMFHSLGKLSALPDQTLLYCGHEYTLANLRFALKVEPQNENIQRRLALTEAIRSKNCPSLPSTIQVEKQTNPFLRCSQKGVIESVQVYAKQKLTKEVDVFRELRAWKNNF